MAAPLADRQTDMKIKFLPAFEVHDCDGIVRRFATKEEATAFCKVDVALTVKRTAQPSARQQIAAFLQTIPASPF